MDVIGIHLAIIPQLRCAKATIAKPLSQNGNAVLPAHLINPSAGGPKGVAPWGVSMSRTKYSNT